MPTAGECPIITGTNSGIGNAWSEILLKEGYKIYALDVNIGEPLKALENKGAKTARVDVSDAGSIIEFKKILQDEPVDVLLNVAGIMVHPDKDTLGTTGYSTMDIQFKINAFGPMLLTQALLPNILAAQGPRRLAVVSSRIGSMGDNSSGGFYVYRASKAAVNSFFKSLSVDLKEKDIIVTILHPGFTKTNLYSDISKIPDAVEPEEAAQGLWGIVKQKGMGDTGKFWHRDGTELPW